MVAAEDQVEAADVPGQDLVLGQAEVVEQDHEVDVVAQDVDVGLDRLQGVQGQDAELVDKIRKAVRQRTRLTRARARDDADIPLRRRDGLVDFGPDAVGRFEAA